jgi:hypothetical protein
MTDDNDNQNKSDDPNGMAGQLDDSQNELADEDDEGEASRGVPQ